MNIGSSFSTIGLQFGLPKTPDLLDGSELNQIKKQEIAFTHQLEKSQQQIEEKDEDFLKEAQEALLSKNRKEEEEKKQSFEQEDKVNALHRELSENRLKETIASFKLNENLPTQDRQKVLVEQKQNLAAAYNLNSKASRVSFSMFS